MATHVTLLSQLTVRNGAGLDRRLVVRPSDTAKTTRGDLDSNIPSGASVSLAVVNRVVNDQAHQAELTRYRND